MTYHEAPRNGACAVCQASYMAGEMIRVYDNGATVHAECDEEKLLCPFCGEQIMASDREPHPSCLMDYLDAVGDEYRSWEADRAALDEHSSYRTYEESDDDGLEILHRMASKLGWS